MDCDWNPTKSDDNRRDRGFGFDVAILIFGGPTIEIEDTRHNYAERRIKAIGAVGDIVLAVIYTDRGNLRRIISAHNANRTERSKWNTSV